MTNKRPQNYTELLTSFPSIKQAIKELDYDEEVQASTNWEGDIDNPASLDKTLGQAGVDHWLDPLIDIVGGEPDYYDISRWNPNLVSKLRIALAVLKDGDSGLGRMTYSDVDLQKCHAEILKSLDYFRVPHDFMTEVNICEMQWNRDVDRDLGPNWAGNMARYLS